MCLKDFQTLKGEPACSQLLGSTTAYVHMQFGWLCLDIVNFKHVPPWLQKRDAVSGSYKIIWIIHNVLVLPVETYHMD